QADVVADDAGALVAQLADRLVDSLCRGGHVDSARRDRGVADAGKVDRDYGEARRELSRQWLPHLGGLRVTVQEEHGGPGAADGDAQGATLDRHHLLLKPGTIIGG